MNCIAQQDRIEKYTWALSDEQWEATEKDLCGQDTCVPGVPSSSRELNPGGNLDAKQSFQKLKSHSKSWAVYQDSTNSTFNSQVSQFGNSYS